MPSAHHASLHFPTTACVDETVEQGQPVTEASAPYLRPTTLKTSPAVRPTCRQGNQSSTRPSVATRVAPRPAPGWSCSGAQEPEGWGAVGALGPVRVGSPRTHDPHPAPRYSTFCLCPPTTPLLGMRQTLLPLAPGESPASLPPLAGTRWKRRNRMDSRCGGKEGKQRAGGQVCVLESKGLDKKTKLPSFLFRPHPNPQAPPRDAVH